MQDLLRGNRRPLKHTRQRGPAPIFQDGGREGESADVGKDQRVLEERRRFLQSRSAAQITDQHSRIEVWQVFEGAACAKHQVIDHRSHGATFEHRIARQFGIFIGPGCFNPRFDLEMLVFKSMRQFMGHHHALVGQRAPICDVEFARLGIVKPLNLLGEHVHHEGIQVESLGKQAKGFGAALVGVAFSGILLFVHLLDDVSADFLARTQRFF